MGDNYLQRLPESLRKPGEHQRGELELLAPDESGDFGIKYEDPYVILVRDRVRFPGGKEGGYIRLINRGELAGSPGAVMVPLWAGSVVFIRIFRHLCRDGRHAVRHQIFRQGQGSGAGERGGEQQGQRETRKLDHAPLWARVFPRSIPGTFRRPGKWR